MSESFPTVSSFLQNIFSALAPVASSKDKELGFGNYHFPDVSNWQASFGLREKILVKFWINWKQILWQIIEEKHTTKEPVPKEVILEKYFFKMFPPPTEKAYSNSCGDRDKRQAYSNYTACTVLIRYGNSAKTVQYLLVNHSPFEPVQILLYYRTSMNEKSQHFQWDTED